MLTWHHRTHCLFAPTTLGLSLLTAAHPFRCPSTLSLLFTDTELSTTAPRRCTAHIEVCTYFQLTRCSFTDTGRSSCNMSDSHDLPEPGDSKLLHAAIA